MILWDYQLSFAGRTVQKNKRNVFVLCSELIDNGTWSFVYLRPLAACFTNYWCQIYVIIYFYGFREAFLPV